MNQIKILCKIVGVLTILIATAGCSNVTAGCQSIPKSVSAYMQKNAGWSIVVLRDLQKDDQNLWNKYHVGLCPGFTEVKLHGLDDKSYAIALIKKGNGQILERLILISNGDSSRAEQIVAPQAVSSPFVVWKTSPGTFRDENTDEDINIENESIIYEKMESTSTQYFIKDGKLKSLLAVD